MDAIILNEKTELTKDFLVQLGYKENDEFILWFEKQRDSLVLDVFQNMIEKGYTLEVAQISMRIFPFYLRDALVSFNKINYFSVLKEKTKTDKEHRREVAEFCVKTLQQYFGEVRYEKEMGIIRQMKNDLRNENTLEFRDNSNNIKNILDYMVKVTRLCFKYGRLLGKSHFKLDNFKVTVRLSFIKEDGKTKFIKIKYKNKKIFKSYVDNEKVYKEHFFKLEDIEYIKQLVDLINEKFDVEV